MIIKKVFAPDQKSGNDIINIKRIDKKSDFLD